MSFYGLKADRDVKINTGGPQTIQIPVAGGNSTIFSDLNSEIEMESEFDEQVFRFSFRPHDGLLYFAKIGQISNFDLSFSSGSFTNEFLGNSAGLVWGGGFRWNITQDTPVSVATALEISYTSTNLGLDAFKSGGVTQAVDDRLEQDEFQGAVNISKRFGTLQPYGGLKLLRVNSRLKDRQTREKISGSEDLVSPFAGLQWEVFPKEYLTVEGSWLDEKMASAGLKINF